MRINLEAVLVTYGSIIASLWAVGSHRHTESKPGGCGGCPGVNEDKFGGNQGYAGVSEALYQGYDRVNECESGDSRVL